MVWITLISWSLSSGSMPSINCTVIDVFFYSPHPGLILLAAKSSAFSNSRTVSGMLGDTDSFYFRSYKNSLLKTMCHKRLLVHPAICFWIVLWYTLKRVEKVVCYIKKHFYMRFQLFLAFWDACPLFEILWWGHEVCLLLLAEIQPYLFVYQHTTSCLLFQAIYLILPANCHRHPIQQNKMIWNLRNKYIFKQFLSSWVYISLCHDE